MKAAWPRHRSWNDKQIQAITTDWTNSKSSSRMPEIENVAAQSKPSSQSRMKANISSNLRGSQ
jgi:hypothetical protein